jgi:GTP-binding protein EngB required for normal cell division
MPELAFIGRSNVGKIIAYQYAYRLSENWQKLPVNREKQGQ